MASLEASDPQEWWDWLIDLAVVPSLFDWIALLLTLGGILIALIKLRTMREATEAATKALTDAQSMLSERALHAIAPQLHHLREDIQLAMKSGVSRDAQRALVRFAALADEVADVLSTSFPAHLQLCAEMQAASAKATRVKVTIVTKPGTDVATVLVPVFKEVDAVVMAIDKMTNGLRNKIEGAVNVH